jgi:hypothetical protein
MTLIISSWPLLIVAFISSLSAFVSWDTDFLTLDLEPCLHQIKGVHNAHLHKT